MTDKPSDAMIALAECAGIEPDLLAREDVAAYLKDMAQALRDMYGDPNPPGPADFDPEWPEEQA